MFSVQNIILKDLSLGCRCISKNGNKKWFSVANCLHRDDKALLAEKERLMRYKDIQIPAKNQKLRFVPKVPQYAAHPKPPHMRRLSMYLHGDEDVFNFLQHGQYGIMAEFSGNMLWGHFEHIKNIVNKYIDPDRMFAVWGVDAPWKPCYKAIEGKTKGGGKGKIHHYSTPIRRKTIILEVGGKCDFEEVLPFLESACRTFPFSARPVSQAMLDNEKKEEKFKEDFNTNKFTSSFVLKNRMAGCAAWIRPDDMQQFDREYKLDDERERKKKFKVPFEFMGKC